MNVLRKVRVWHRIFSSERLVNFYPVILLIAFPIVLSIFNYRWLFSNYYIDDWIYYGLFMRDNPIFRDVYYNDRMGVIFPGRLIYSILPPIEATIVHRLLNYYVVVFAFYATAKILYNQNAALLATIIMGSSPFFLRSMGATYESTGIAYFSLCLYMITVSGVKNGVSGSKYIFWAGFFAGSMFHSNIVWSAFFLSLFIFYISRKSHFRVKSLLSDIFFAFSGFFAAAIFFGVYAILIGKPAHFFRNSLSYLEAPLSTPVSSALSDAFSVDLLSWLIRGYLIIPIGIFLVSGLFLIRTFFFEKRLHPVAAPLILHVSFFLIAFFVEFTRLRNITPLLSQPYYSTILLPTSFLSLGALVSRDKWVSLRSFPFFFFFSIVLLIFALFQPCYIENFHPIVLILQLVLIILWSLSVFSEKFWSIALLTSSLFLSNPFGNYIPPAPYLTCSSGNQSRPEQVYVYVASGLRMLDNLSGDNVYFFVDESSGSSIINVLSVPRNFMWPYTISDFENRSLFLPFKKIFVVYSEMKQTSIENLMKYLSSRNFVPANTTVFRFGDIPLYLAEFIATPTTWAPGEMVELTTAMGNLLEGWASVEADGAWMQPEARLQVRLAARPTETTTLQFVIPFAIGHIDGQAQRVTALAGERPLAQWEVRPGETLYRVTLPPEAFDAAGAATLTLRAAPPYSSDARRLAVKIAAVRYETTRALAPGEMAELTTATGHLLEGWASAEADGAWMQPEARLQVRLAARPTETTTLQFVIPFAIGHIDGQAQRVTALAGERPLAQWEVRPGETLYRVTLPPEAFDAAGAATLTLRAAPPYSSDARRLAVKIAGVRYETTRALAPGEMVELTTATGHLLEGWASVEADGAWMQPEARLQVRLAARPTETTTLQFIIPFAIGHIDGQAQRVTALAGERPLAQWEVRPGETLYRVTLPPEAFDAAGAATLTLRAAPPYSSDARRLAVKIAGVRYETTRALAPGEMVELTTATGHLLEGWASVEADGAWMQPEARLQVRLAARPTETTTLQFIIPFAIGHIDGQAQRVTALAGERPLAQWEVRPGETLYRVTLPPEAFDAAGAATLTLRAAPPYSSDARRLAVKIAAVRYETTRALAPGETAELTTATGHLLEGWASVEADGAWMQPEARLRVRLAARPTEATTLQFVIPFAIGHIDGQAQRVTALAGERPLAQWEVRPGEALYRVTLPPEAFDVEGAATLTLRAAPPYSSDARRLAVKIAAVRYETTRALAPGETAELTTATGHLLEGWASVEADGAWMQPEARLRVRLAARPTEATTLQFVIPFAIGHIDGQAQRVTALAGERPLAQWEVRPGEALYRVTLPPEAFDAAGAATLTLRAAPPYSSDARRLAVKIAGVRYETTRALAPGEMAELTTATGHLLEGWASVEADGAWMQPEARLQVRLAARPTETTTLQFVIPFAIGHIDGQAQRVTALAGERPLAQWEVRPGETLYRVTLPPEAFDAAGAATLTLRAAPPYSSDARRLAVKIAGVRYEE
jgi:hypothetical protein